MVVSKLNLQRYCIEGPFLNNVFIDFLFDYDKKKGCLKNLVYSGSLLGDTELWFTDYVDGELNGSRNKENPVPTATMHRGLERHLPCS